MIGLAACLLLPTRVHAAGGETVPPRTWAFVCPGDFGFVVRAEDGWAWVFLPGVTARLEVVAGSAPARYVGGGLHLAIDGQTGTLIKVGQAPRVCRNDPQQAVWEHAKLDGVDFRAVGNEPPWVLEIRERSRAVLTTGYERTRIERALPPPSNDPATRSSRWDGGDLQIEVTLEDCLDTMSGERSSARVVVHWQGSELRGCGRALH